MKTASLVAVDLPDFGEPEVEPTLTHEIYLARHDRLLTGMMENRYDALVIYGDREHMANIAWATGYDPRFEEAVYVVLQDRKPMLFAGNEGFPYAETAFGDFHRVLWPQLSLMGQPRARDRPLAQLLKEAGLENNMRIGLAGWKGFEDEAGTFDPHHFETPHYLVEALKDIGSVTNAALLFMHPETGLRVHNEIDQLARFEFAATLSSNAIKRVIMGAQPGMTEYNACRNMMLNGFPQSTHINMCSGPRAKYGLPSPSMRVLERGEPVVVGLGLMGALNCRAGFLVADQDELPPLVRDYIKKLVAPYFSAAVAWYETIGIGVEGGAVYDAVMDHVGDPFFGVSLNPGHLIHLEEWLHSPIKKNSRMKFTSGMALQCDIIPATGTDYFMSNIEDGIALLDALGRKQLSLRHPEAWSRIERRRTFMMETLGISLKPEVLPFSNMAAWLPPFWLAPHLAMAMRS